MGAEALVLHATGVATVKLLGAAALVAPTGGAQSTTPASPTATGTYTAKAKTNQGPILVGLPSAHRPPTGSRPLRV